MTAKSTRDDDDDDFIDDETDWSDDPVELSDEDISGQGLKKTLQRQRDWRDMERYKEELELKRLMKDDYLLDDDDRSWRH